MSGKCEFTNFSENKIISHRISSKFHSLCNDAFQWRINCFFTDKHTKIIVGAAVAVGTLTAAGLAYLYAKHSEGPIPTKFDHKIEQNDAFD